MAAVRVFCTECNATLKLGAAPAPGKKVKCPKCKALFVPMNEEDEEEIDAPAPDQPVQTAARQATVPMPKPKASVKPEPPKKTEDDDDDGGGTYALLDAGEEKKKEDDDEEEDDKPFIEYGNDETTKDLRGPAQVRVNKPCNLLMMCGAIGVIGWLIVLVIAVIAVFLPVQEDAGKDETGKRITGQALVPGVGAVAKSVDAAEPKLTDHEKEYMQDQQKLADKAKSDMIIMFTANVLLFIIMLTLCGLGMVWGFLIMVGGVKVINLESRAWGFVSAIMVMFPFHTLGPIMLLSMVFTVIFISMLEDAGLAGMFILVGTSVLCLLNLGVGAYMIMTLLSEPVVAGFEYKAE